MTKLSYSHLCKEQRNNIEHLINSNKNFTYISKAIGVDRTTISKEIKRNCCSNYSTTDLFNKNIIQKSIDKCTKLQNPPYVCNNCPNKRYCNKSKIYYNAKLAQEHYENRLIESRSGVDITPEIIEEIENIIVPLIKNKKQSVNQVYAHHSDILFFSKPTFYKYIDIGVLSLSNIDLPKKVIYKNRKAKYDTSHKRQLALLQGRSYNDFIDFTDKHPKMNIVEMDTVEGKRSGKVFFTLLIRDTKFMFIRLMDKKNIACVNKEIDNLKSILGIQLFSKIFRIVLTDNGSEFFDPLRIEIDYENGNKTTNVFYCDPYSSFQKGQLERNHEYIRRVFPKGYSFDDLNKNQVLKLETIINNIPRNKFDGKSPYEMTYEKYPELIEKLNYKYILPDDIELTIEKVLREDN